MDQMIRKAIEDLLCLARTELIRGGWEKPLVATTSAG